MALLNPARVLADEGLLGALRIVGNLIKRSAARRRVIDRDAAHLPSVPSLADRRYGSPRRARAQKKRYGQ